MLASELELDLRDLVDWGENGLSISMLEKLSFFRLTTLITQVLFLLKWMVLFM